MLSSSYAACSSLLKSRASASRSHQARSPSQKILADYAASESSVFLVADIQGQIIGDLTCNGGSRRATRHSAMLGMSIDREWRNKGIGSLLMTNAIEWARNAGISRIELYVFARNQVAIHLYEKFGFVVEGCRRRAVYRDGEYHDALIMALLL
jgi:RimJ/RimL family protein N-acetyltransferase